MSYPFVMFDWGDTIMKDEPALKTPMYQWPNVEAIDGAEAALSLIYSRSTIAMATGAAQSDEPAIRKALQRVNLEQYFRHIFCFKNTGLRKPSEGFYHYILDKLKVSPADIVMVGDHFENDVLAANRVGIAGIWLNRMDAEDRMSDLYRTIHSLRDLPACLYADLEHIKGTTL